MKLYNGKKLIETTVTPITCHTSLQMISNGNINPLSLKYQALCIEHEAATHRGTLRRGGAPQGHPSGQGLAGPRV